MTKSDLMELKKRFKKEACTIDRMAGCYVDASRNKVVKINQSFLNLPDEEFYKYLDIIKKAMTGKIGNNILELSFPNEEEAAGGRQQFLMGIRADRFAGEELLDRLYDMIIENYHTTDNYLILLFHDCYDIIKRSSDNLKLDESEEVYEYILAAICPVELSKPALGYRADENRIGVRLRDWVVGAPALGFLFPAFDNHGADIHKVDYYVKDAKESHKEFIEGVLGCGAKKTATEQRRTFAAIVKHAFGFDEDKGKEALNDIQEDLQNIVIEESGEVETESTPMPLSTSIMEKVLSRVQIDAEPAEEIRRCVSEEFADETPNVEDVIDTKALAEVTRKKKERELVKEVASLKQQLKVSEEMLNIDEDGESETVLLKVSEDVAERVRSEIIDNQRCIVIPVDEDAVVKVNGVEY